MPKSCSIAQARHDLSHLIHEAEGGQSIHLTRYGHPVAVLVSEFEFERLYGARLGFWDAFYSFCQTYSNVMIERDELIHERSKDTGRVCPWT